ncbi:hypothetical protein CIPAW_11G068400 [Carya illinoinensis]|uniref:Uncharacterized protein n=1 Tax=Carya illinoinensis TaxID=32201 RepID=A0A8T1P1R3_CARIL|nr:hypothetical protein CIPAW_11G068400 [Carya illinoinensis]
MPSANLSRTKTPATRRLTSNELQERRKKALCFNCDEQFTPGRRCKKLFLIEGIYVQDTDRDDEVEMEEQLEFNEELRISLHAMVGTIPPQTMRIQGAIMGQGITILLDFGSSYNFLNASSTKKMGLVS